MRFIYCNGVKTGVNYIINAEKIEAVQDTGDGCYVHLSSGKEIYVTNSAEHVVHCATLTIGTDTVKAKEKK